MADSPPNILEVFSEALARESDAERSAYLDDACRNDHLARARVEALLRAHSDSENFLGGQAPGRRSALDQSVTEQIGTFVGPYKLSEQIGEGGMGVVYMAEQKEPVRRSVALKIIKPGMDTEEVVARFEVERQALALMSHPNIAKVLDAGATESGRPYFVMELVRGIPITEFCDQRRLDLTQRLELFVTVCQAVQHAHQKGIIHRDIKPSNILVELHDVIAVPKVIDFGVAKATKHQLTDLSLHTGFAQMIGTPLYMSPEQAELSGLDVDTRTDIYSLGVVLYELLTGTTPFVSEALKQASYDEMRRIIREDAPPKPSNRISTLAAESLSTVSTHRSTDPRKLSQIVRGELDWIVMKALDKDRTRRYESAGAMAADIQHYLHDEPVVACPPSVTYRFGKFARRNKVALLMTGLACLALLVGTIGLGVSNQLIKRERDAATAERFEAELQKKAAKAQKQAAEANYRRARNAVDEYLVKVSENQLLNAPSLEPLRRDLLTLALKYYQEFIAEHSDDPELRRESGRAHVKAAEVLALLHQHEEADKIYRRAIGMFEKLVMEEPDQPENRHYLAEGYQQLGDLLGTLGRLAEQEEAYRKAVATENPLVTEFPREPRYGNLLATCYSNLARAMLVRGQVDQAAELFQQGQAAPNLEQERSSPARSTGAAVRQAAGQLQVELGRLKEAEQTYRQSRQLWARLSSEFPDQAKYRESLSNSIHDLATVLVRQGQRQQANGIFREAIEIERQLVRDAPVVPRYRASLANSLNGLANSSTEPELIEVCRRECLEIYKQLVRDFPDVPAYSERLAMYLHNMGDVYKDREGGSTDAELYYRESITTNQQLVEMFPDVPEYMASIAMSEMCIGLVLTHNPERWDEAETALRQALRKYRKLSQKYLRSVDYLGQVPLCLGFMGRLWHRMNRLEEAEIAYHESVALYERLVSDAPEMAEFHIWLGKYRIELATVLNKLDRDAESATQLELAVEAAHKAVELHPAASDIWNEWNRAVLLHYRSQSWEGAEIEARLAVKVAPDDPDLLLRIVPLFLLADKEEEYRQLCMRLLKVAQDQSTEEHRQITNWIVRLCGLDPQAARDPARVLRLAQAALVSSDHAARSRCALGRAFYRAGESERAVEWLQKALQDGSASKPLIYLDMALAHHYGGRPDEAREWLEKATQSLEEGQEASSDGHERMEIEVLRREAEQLIRADAKPVDDPQAMRPRRDDVALLVSVPSLRCRKRDSVALLTDEGGLS